MKNIIFTNTLNNNFYEPTPAINDLPKWYKSNKSYHGDRAVVEVEKGNSTTATIKKCKPVWDSLTAGYYLYTQVDVLVKQTGEGQYYSWPSQNAIGFHSTVQVENHPKVEKEITPIPKFQYPYIIETPKGWSCLFTPPMHNENPYFEILPAIVDTDTYKSCISFVFTLKDSNFEGLIPAGTLMAQVIPIKRENWKMKKGNIENIKEHFRIVEKLGTKFYNRYKTFFWTQKHYN